MEVDLTEGAGERLAARLMYDLKRLNLDWERVQRALMCGSQAECKARSSFPLASLIQAALISSQPARGKLQQLLAPPIGYGAASCAKWALVSVHALLVVAIPFGVPTALRVATGREDFVWMMLPGQCDCDCDKDASGLTAPGSDCVCVSASWEAIVALALAYRPLRANMISMLREPASAPPYCTRPSIVRTDPRPAHGSVLRVLGAPAVRLRPALSSRPPHQVSSPSP